MNEFTLVIIVWTQVYVIEILLYPIVDRDFDLFSLIFCQLVDCFFLIYWCLVWLTELVILLGSNSFVFF